VADPAVGHDDRLTERAGAERAGVPLQRASSVGNREVRRDAGGRGRGSGLHGLGAHGDSRGQVEGALDARAQGGGERRVRSDRLCRGGQREERVT
jgi:hypothetical protein